MGKHLEFHEGPPKPKTRTWFVVNSHDNFHLGWIGWFGRWRKYAFYPKPDTVYEEDCLRQIAEFCVDATKSRRIEKKSEATHG